MIDLDHFKRVNDTYGHSTGDLVLQAIAETCQRKLRKSDIFGRYGGEEFVIIMPETDEQRAWNVAERLRRSIVHISIPINDGAIAITISLGVATLSPEDLCSDNSGDLLEKLIDKADQALYQAKQAGRNRVIVHQENVPI
jgi:diguanylate cyclase (GGDEF)-like protein